MKIVASLLATAVAFATLASTVAAKTEGDYFRECFCWDEKKQEFCGGSDWYNSDACDHWFWAAFGFAVPAVIGLFVLLLFPCIFYTARICCNCCGGRRRSEGCCCPDSGADHRVPEYTNRAIFVSKLLMSIVFGVYIYYAVGGYVTNAKLHSDIMNVLGDFGNSVDSVGDLVGKSSQELQHLSNLSMAGPHLPPPGFAQESVVTNAAFHKRVGEIHDQLNNIRHVERDQQWGREESVYRYPSCVLLVLLIAVMLMGCNVRKAMGPMMILVCLTTILEGIVFIPHMMMAQGVSSMCDSYNETVVPVVVGAVQSQGGCGSDGFILGLNMTAANLQQQLWFPNQVTKDFPSELCQAMRTVCNAKQCAYTTCSGSGAQLPFTTDDERMPFNIPAIDLVMTTPFSGQDHVPFNQRQTIMTCAISSCNDQPLEVQMAARQLAQFYEDQYASLAFLFMEAYPLSRNCAGVRDHLQNPLYGDICDGGINRRMTNAAMVLGVMYLLGFLAIPVIIRGMKRFMPMRRNQSLADVARETVLYADSKANAVPDMPPYEVAEGTAVYGTVNDAPAGPSQARLAGDAAFQRRFYGPNAVNASDAVRRPLLQGEAQAGDEPSAVSMADAHEAPKPL